MRTGIAMHGELFAVDDTPARTMRRNRREETTNARPSLERTAAAMPAQGGTRLSGIDLPLEKPATHVCGMTRRNTICR
jgi:hypothetical protein